MNMEQLAASLGVSKTAPAVKTDYTQLFRNIAAQTAQSAPEIRITLPERNENMNLLGSLGKGLAGAVTGLVKTGSPLGAVAGALGGALSANSGKSANLISGIASNPQVSMISANPLSNIFSNFTQSLAQPSQLQLPTTSSSGGVYQWRNGRGYTERVGGRTICHVSRRDGTIKTYRPYRSIVLGKKIKVSSIKRAEHRMHTIATALSPYLAKHRTYVPHRRNHAS